MSDRFARSGRRPGPHDAARPTPIRSTGPVPGHAGATPPAAGDGWPLTGRDEDLDGVRAALDRCGAVVIAGAPGVGRTRLAREVLACAVADGATPAWTAATASTSMRTVPHGVPGISVVRPTGDALRVDGPRHALVVDDAHLLDGASAGVLLQLAMERAVSMVVTLRVGEPAPDAVTALWKDGWARRWDVSPLAEPDVVTLLEAVLDGPVDAPTARRLHEATAGDLLWLRHLVEGERAAGRLRWSRGRWVWRGEPRLTPALDDLVALRVGPLADGEARVLELVAFGAPVELGVLTALTAAADVERLADRGLIVVGSDGWRTQVSPGHPLFAMSLRGRVSTPRARRLRGELAAALVDRGTAGDGLRRAVLGLDSDRPVDPGSLTAAAAEATAAGDLPLAERLHRVARDAGAGFEAQLGLAQTLAYLGRADAEAELTGAAELAATPAHRTRVTLVLATTLHLALARPDDARRALDQRSRVPDGAAPPVELEAARAVVDLVSDRIVRASHRARVVLDRADALPAARAWAGFAALGGRALSGRGPAVDELVADAATAARAAPETLSLPAGLGVLAVVGHGIDGRLDRARACAEPGGRHRAAGVLGCLQDAWIALESGTVRTAARLLTGLGSSLPGHGGGWTAWVELLAAQALGMAGDAVGARAALARADDAEHPGVGVLRPERMLAEAWVAAADGARREAITLAGRAAAHAADGGQQGVEARIRHTAVCFGDGDQSRALSRLARVLDGPRGGWAARHATALATRDADALLAVSAELDEAGLGLVAADAAAQAAVVLRHHHGRADRATAAGGRAAALAARCEEPRTPALSAAAAPQRLSERERDVATLTARGLSDRQIAERLHVSVRTVESHVHRACARLGFADRLALAAAVVPRLVEADDPDGRITPTRTAAPARCP